MEEGEFEEEDEEEVDEEEEEAEDEAEVYLRQKRRGGSRTNMQRRIDVIEERERWLAEQEQLLKVYFVILEIRN